VASTILPSLDAVMVFAAVVVVWAMIVPMLISRKPDSRMEFFWSLMEGFTSCENNSSAGTPSCQRES